MQSEGTLSSSFQSGGYDYEFLEEPAEDVNCSICLSVLRDPHLTSCCGNHFCQSCITRIKDDGNPCPLCQERNFTTMLNKSISRKIRELTIHCPNKTEGCQWTGIIRDVESHLDGENGCGYVIVECTLCDESFARLCLADHQMQSCPYRPYTCEYCGCKDPMKVITEDHWPVCSEYPVPCPNNCEVELLKRKNLDSHVKENCPLQEVSCEFFFAGCNVQIARRDLSSHMVREQSTHLTLLAVKFQQHATQSNKSITELETTIQQKDVERDKRIADLEKVVRDQRSVLLQKDALLSERDRRIEKLEAVVKQQGEQVREFKLTIEHLKNDSEAKCFPPVDLYMEDLNWHWSVEDQWFSEPFYSHPGGYKMCLSVYANGTGQGVGSHVSVFAHLMRGEYDDKLTWPYRGNVQVTLVTDEEDYEEKLKFTSKSPAKAAKRVEDGDRNDYGQGLSKFVEWDDVSYLSSLHFRVQSVECKSI